MYKIHSYKPVALLLIISWITISCHTGDNSSHHVWQRWETTLTSDTSYDNPCKDVTVTTKFKGPNDEMFTAAGFWKGGNNFIIRTAFPSEGTWHWETECSDTLNNGLHNKRGEVSVRSYTGENPLYMNGFLRVSGNNRYLTYDNMEPFLWIGATAWIAPLRASMDDWQTYIDDCVAKKFSVVQISPASSWGGDSVDVQGNVPFMEKDLNKINPKFWDGFDEKVQYANEKGIVIFIVGLMEPVDRYPSLEEASLFARHIAGRMAGNFVILSPSFDSKFMELGNEVGRVINKTTSRHLITQHPGTPSRKPIHIIADRYYNEDYLDFSMCQSGHNGGNMKLCVWQAIHWNLDLYSRGKKPVINGEAYYEGDTIETQRHPKFLGTADDARKLGYLSFLSGAPGYTYGALGHWNWEIDSTKASHWKKAMHYPGGMQMKFMYEFFADINWWELAPAHDLVLNQRSDTLSYMTLSKSKENDLLVAYLPASDKIVIDLDDFDFPLKVRWFDPIANSYIESGIRQKDEGNEFLSPGLAESLLLLQK